MGSLRRSGISDSFHWRYPSASANHDDADRGGSNVARAGDNLLHAWDDAVVVVLEKRLGTHKPEASARKLEALNPAAGELATGKPGWSEKIAWESHQLAESDVYRAVGITAVGAGQIKVRQSLVLWSLAFAVVSCPYAAAVENSMSSVSNSPEIAQINICGVGQWFTLVRNGQCETHPGASVNPAWIGYVTADDYSRWYGHKVAADSLSKAGRLIWLGDHRFVFHFKGNYFHSEHAMPLCLPQLPETWGHEGGSLVQVPGCNGTQLDKEPWSQTSQCSPASRLSTIVRLLVANGLGVAIEHVGLQSRLIKDLGADHLDVVEIVMAAHETFPSLVEFPPVKIGKGEDPIGATAAGGGALVGEAYKEAELLVTVQDLLSYVASKICR
jgi:acyl carrier protein